MKKFLWLAMISLVLPFAAGAQNNSLTVTGLVLDFSNPVPVPVTGQSVDITIDSTGSSFSYQNTVFTDSTGFFTDEITLPPEVQFGFVTASTFDYCLGYNVYEVSFFGMGMNLPPFNFFLCQNNPLDCAAMFFWDLDPADPLTVQFTDMSYGTYDSWLWDFGDGNSSTEQNPVHTYAEEGLYEVCLTISDSTGFCLNTACDYILVGANPWGCENFFYYYFADSLTAEFTGFLIDSSYQVLSYDWDFGDGTTGTGQTISHTFQGGGNSFFLVCLTTAAVDDSGDTCISISCQEVFPGGPPPPSPCESHFIPVNQYDLTVEFEAFTISPYPTTFSWDFGDNYSGTGQSVSHTYAEEGVYLVVLTSIDSTGCESEFMMDVIVGSPPPVGCDNFFTYFQNDSTTFTFTGEVIWNDSLNGYQTDYFWDFGDGNTAYGQTVTHSFQGNPAGGAIYPVCLSTMSYSSEGDSCFAISCQDIVIGNGGWDCANWFEYWPDGLTIGFEGYVLSGLPADYAWEFGDGTSGTGQQVSHTYAESGVYPVTLTTIDTAGCTWTSVMMVLVNIFPSYSVSGFVTLENGTYADDATVRLMSTDSLFQNVIELSSTTISDSGYYHFDSVTMNPFQLYYLQAELNAGSAWSGQYLPTYYINALTWQEAMPVMPINNWPYDITLIPGTPVNSGEGSITGNVVSLGSRDVVEGMEVMLMTETMAPITYTRSDVNGEFRFENLAFGTYMIHAEMMGMNSTPVQISLHEQQPEASVEVQVSNGEISYIFSVTEQLSILEEAGNVYPNPATGNARIELTSKAPAAFRLDIYNQVGQLTWSQQVDLTRGPQQVTLPMEHMPAGFYYLKVTSAEGDFVTRRIVKSNN